MKVSKLPIFLALGLITLLVIKSFLLALVPPATIGVKQSLWGGGVIEEDYGMGYHWGVLGVHKWHTLDARTHFLTFMDGGRSSASGEVRPPLVIRTKDNNIATFDLTLTYHITKGKGHELVNAGLKGVYKSRVFTTAESVIREELAELSSEDIYATENRLRISEVALPKLAKELEAFFVTPDQILVRAVTFTEAYERKLQEKQLTNQRRLLATAQKRVEDQKAITETRQASIEADEKESRGDWDKRLETLRAENELAIAKVKAETLVYDASKRTEADATYEELLADGNLAIAKSEAKRDELRNKALDTTGGHILLAKQAAENLNFESVTLNSNDADVPSILNLGELVKLLIGDG